MSSPLPPPHSQAQPHRLRRALVVLLAAVALLLGLDALAPTVLRAFDERVSDVAWRVSPLGVAERRLVVVDFDEASLAEVGPWPWPRERLAELSRRLAALGAGLQVFDIVLSDARPGDADLAAALAATPSVLGQVLVLDGNGGPRAGQVAGALTAPPCAAPLPVASGYLAPAPAFAGVAAGHITPRLDRDGAVRRVPAFICHQGASYPALALAALQRGAGLAPAFQLAAGQGLLDPAWVASHPDLPGIRLPLDAAGDWRVSYRLPRSAFVSIPAADILAGRAPAELLQGAWVLIGGTALGIADAVPTPQGSGVSGVEVHAQLAAALLDGRTPYTPRGAPWFQALAVLVMALLLLALAARRRPATAILLPVAGLALAGLAVAAEGTLLLGANLWIGAGLPAVFALVAGVALGVVEHLATRRERELVYSNLASYLPARAAAEIALTAPVGTIAARRETLTLLRADLRNFSAWCERCPAEDAAAVLHHFYSESARLVEAAGGSVLEYVGDAVLAVWPETPAGSPVADSAQQRAVAAARAIEAEVGAALPPPPAGLEPLAVGIGIETGAVLVGSFGPAARRTHTALGEAVTVAIRLQGYTTDLAQPVLLGPRAAAALPPAELVDLGSFLLEGLVAPRRIYGLRPLSSIIGAP